MDLLDLPRPGDMRETVLVTHRGCMDGSGCVVMFAHAGGLLENVRFVAAGMVERFVKEDPVFHSGRFLVFADVGLNAPKYSDVLEKRGDCVVIDHHKTSLHMRERTWANVDVGACGTELLRRYLRLPTDGFDAILADVIDDHDRWQGKYAESHDYAMWMSFLGQDEFIQRVLRKQHVALSGEEQDVVNVLRKRRDESIEDILRHVITRELVIGGVAFRVGYVVTDEPNTSMLLHRLLERRRDVHVAAQLMVGTARVSLRSRGDFDVSELARKFGGGGHAVASGHSIPNYMVEELVKGVHDV